jgi:hypothetical protein
MTSSPSFMEFNNISKLLSLVFFRPYIAKSQQQKPAIQKLTKESFLKGSDEFKLEEVIAEFERKGIDEKYYKDLGDEGKVL